MDRIKPDILRRLQKFRNLTQAQLAEKAKINPQTIWPIEHGSHKSTRPRTIEQIAKALGVEQAVLTGEAPMPEVQGEKNQERVKSQLNVRVNTAARNALILVARRYGVARSDIVELAPFLFCWAAEESLRQRSERISEFDHAFDQSQSIGQEIRHLSPPSTIQLVIQ